jgi:hypothetical protein
LADRPIDRAVVVERSIGVRRRVMCGRVRASSLDAVLVIEARVVRPFRARGSSAERRCASALEGARDASVGEGSNGIGRRESSVDDGRARARASGRE